MPKDAFLVPLKDAEGVPTGYYRCSLCNVEFSGDARDADGLAAGFAVHVGMVHGRRRKPIEGVSETAARVVEEAIRKLPKK
jgi:hypothetical protein